MRKGQVLLFAVFVLSAVLTFAAGTDEDLKTGEILDRIVCRQAPDQSYALYLPSAYDASRKWPILYAFDPGARGKIPLELFQGAAEKYGYIIVGSNNSQNGPWESVRQAVLAVWSDTHSRLSLDDRRIYTAGFSGGARAASLFSRMSGRTVAGIIGCGAGLALNFVKPEDLKSVAYFGIVGLADLNYSEMMQLDRDLAAQDVEHRILVFEGKHDWPPAEICARAVGWMEIVGMKREIRPRDEALIEEIFTAGAEEARSLEEAGNVPRAASACESLGNLFKNIRDTGAIAEHIAELRKQKAYVQGQKDEAKRAEKETAVRSRLVRGLARLDQPFPDPGLKQTLISEMGINSLLKEAAKAKTAEDRGLASRLLHDLAVNANQQGRRYYQENDFAKSSLFFEIADQASALNPDYRRYILFSLACLHALEGDAKKALKSLRSAVENGFADIEAIETDKDLDSLRKLPEYREIIQTLKK